MKYVCTYFETLRLCCAVKYSKPSPIWGNWGVGRGSPEEAKILISEAESSHKTKLHGLSPRANYTDRATVACRQCDCQLFADRGCHVVSVTDPYGRILGFLDREPLLFYQVAPQLYSRG
jgi:hypothetical protein